MDISKKILSDPVTRWLFAQKSDDLYLAGGHLRDLIIGRKSKDRDFAYKGDAAKLAIQVAKRFNGKYILLKDGLTCRVVLIKDKSIIDINYLTESIDDDLARRDFTINAIAWSPDRGILDPFKGLSDINKKLIRVINPENFKADPLRILRAYRFSAQLGYKINPKTRDEMRKYAKFLTSTAPERITDELIKILNEPNVGKSLQLSANDNVLSYILKIEQDTLLFNIMLIKKFDSSSNTLSIEADYLQTEISQTITRSGMIRLAMLLLESKKLSNINCRCLRLSRINTAALKGILHAVHHTESARIDQSMIYRAFCMSGDYSIEAAVLIGIIKRREILPLVLKARRFLNIRSEQLLTGDTIKMILGIGPSHRIGVILARLEEERFNGNISSKLEAKNWILSNFT